MDVALRGAADAKDAIREQSRSTINLQRLPIVIKIRIQNSVAHGYGLHLWKKTPRDGSPQVTRRDRYVVIWRKNEKGGWKLRMYVSNANVSTQMLAGT